MGELDLFDRLELLQPLVYGLERPHCVLGLLHAVEQELAPVHPGELAARGFGLAPKALQMLRDHHHHHHRRQQQYRHHRQQHRLHHSAHWTISSAIFGLTMPCTGSVENATTHTTPRHVLPARHFTSMNQTRMSLSQRLDSVPYCALPYHALPMHKPGQIEVAP